MKNEVRYGVKEQRNILCTIKRRTASWIGHILLKNDHIKHIIEGEIEGMRRRGRRRKQLLNDLREDNRN
jgi:superfamily I DNA and RNA helicase